MKTVITSNSSLLTILRSRSALILIALAVGTLALVQTSGISKSAAGWRVSRRQYGGGTERPFESHHRRFQHGGWFLFAQE